MLFSFRKKKYQAGGSPGKDAFHKLKKKKLALWSIYFILFSTLVSILGYLICPDPTPMANRQFLELAAKKPGFSVQMLRVKKVQEIEQHNPFYIMLFGQEDAFELIPVEAIQIRTDSIIAHSYLGISEEQGRELIFAKQSLDSQNPIMTKTFWLGSDRFGRDVLSQLIIGARVSLSVGFIAVAISLLIGLLAGSLAGYFKGWIDEAIMWLINVVWSIPTLLLVIAITFALGRGFWQVFVAVGLTMWVEVARVVRGQILSIREKEFIEATRAMGFSNARIIYRHILPNVISPVIVISAANFASAILIEAGLSFLGIGVQPPTPSWGSMIRENYSYLILDAAHLAILPGIAIMLMVLAFMLLGNGLRDALDVKAN
jgi:peptide/nickel transport system permease protein